MYLGVSPSIRVYIISDNRLLCYEMRRSVVSCTLTKHFGITCCIRLQHSWIWRQPVSLKHRVSPAARNDIQKTVLLQYLRLSQRCCWRIVFFWAVTLCHGVSSSWRFEGSQLLHLQGPCLTVKMNALHLFKTSGNTDPLTKCHIPDDLTGRSCGRLIRPVTSNTNRKYSSTVWPVPPHPQRTPFCSSL